MKIIWTVLPWELLLLLKAKILEAKYEANLEFPGGSGGRAKQRPSVDIPRVFSGTAHCFGF